MQQNVDTLRYVPGSLELSLQTDVYLGNEDKIQFFTSFKKLARGGAK